MRGRYVYLILLLVDYARVRVCALHSLLRECAERVESLGEKKRKETQKMETLGKGKLYLIAPTFGYVVKYRFESREARARYAKVLCENGVKYHDLVYGEEEV